jgi:hypothetical protein
VGAHRTGPSNLGAVCGAALVAIGLRGRLPTAPLSGIFEG